MVGFECSIARSEELRKEKIDLSNDCASGDYCGKGLEKFYNNCTDVKTWVRCWIAQLLDKNRLRSEWYEPDSVISQ